MYISKMESHLKLDMILPQYMSTWVLKPSHL